MNSINSASRNGLAVYGTVLACVLAIVLMVQGNYESTAGRLDLKVMTLELKKQANVIDRMGVLRNRIRAKAEMLQFAAFAFVVSMALFSWAVSLEGVPSWPFMWGSLVMAVVGGGMILLCWSV